ncbi:MAG: desulfoferrodoxin [Prevotella sp.]|nr:desulfoferrodoxin [Prevotella sp.]
MTKVNEIYKCNVCGNIIAVVHPAGGKLTCCGQPMVLMGENTTDGSMEKHVPIVENIEGGIKVSVGSVAHPMTEEHYIEWIEWQAGDCTLRKHLHPGEEPTAFFKTGKEGGTARAYCNLHGLWKSK